MEEYLLQTGNYICAENGKRGEESLSQKREGVVNRMKGDNEGVR